MSIDGRIPFRPKIPCLGLVPNLTRREISEATGLNLPHSLLV